MSDCFPFFLQLIEAILVCLIVEVFVLILQGLKALMNLTTVEVLGFSGFFRQRRGVLMTIFRILTDTVRLYRLGDHCIFHIVLPERGSFSFIVKRLHCFFSRYSLAKLDYLFGLSSIKATVCKGLPHVLNFLLVTFFSKFFHNFLVPYSVSIWTFDLIIKSIVIHYFIEYLGDGILSGTSELNWSILRICKAVRTSITTILTSSHRLIKSLSVLQFRWLIIKESSSRYFYYLIRAVSQRIKLPRENITRHFQLLFAFI